MPDPKSSPDLHDRSPNPYAVTTLEMSSPLKTFGPRGQRIAALCTIIYLVIATGVACYEIESIMVTGLILLAIGVGLAISDWRYRHSGIRLMAIACLAFPVLCFGLIAGCRWGPSDAQWPISSLCVLFTAAISCLAVVTVLRKSPTILPDR